MTTFDVLCASINGEPVEITSKNGRADHHELQHGIVNLGEYGLNLSIRLPPNIQAGEHDLILRLKIG